MKTILAILCFSVTAIADSLWLGWNASPSTNVTGYRLLIGTAQGQYSVTNDVGNVLTCQATNLSPGVTYYFAVVAYDSSSTTSIPSNEVYWRAVHRTVRSRSVSVIGAVKVMTNQ